MQSTVNAVADKPQGLWKQLDIVETENELVALKYKR